LFRRRGQSPAAIAEISLGAFIKKILKQHILRESALRMEATRLRGDIGQALESIGAPYSGEHFLPLVSHGTGMYCLSGNRRLIHIPGSLLSMNYGDAQGGSQPQHQYTEPFSEDFTAAKSSTSL
jgi:hypothetical protein